MLVHVGPLGRAHHPHLRRLIPERGDREEDVDDGLGGESALPAGHAAAGTLDGVGAGTEPSRIAAASDAAEIGALLDRFQLEYASFTPGAETLAQRAAVHIASGASVFLLAAPRDVGVAQLRFREYLITGEPVCTLEELYVIPERRGEGHGRWLVRMAFAVARERGATSIELGTARSDTAARGLYESLGFTNLERPGDPETEMLYYERSL